MEELLKALTEAVRTGTAMAMPALIGYYVVYVLTQLAPPASFVVVIGMAAKTVRFGIQQYWANIVAAEQATTAKYNAYHKAAERGYRPPTD